MLYKVFLRRKMCLMQTFLFNEQFQYASVADNMADRHKQGTLRIGKAPYS
jgi:hypothetical protein